MNTEHKHAKWIKALGGASVVAAKLGIDRRNVQNWLRRGIPAQVQLDNASMWKRAQRL